MSIIVNKNKQRGTESHLKKDQNASLIPKKKCEFKHDQHNQTNKNAATFELLSQTRSLNLEEKTL